LDGLSQPRVGFDLSLLDLLLHPFLEIVHHRLAVRLVKSQAVQVREFLLLGEGIEPIHLAQAFNDLAAFLREVLDHVHKLAPSVQEAVTQQRVELFGFVAREGIAHLHGLVQSNCPALEQLVKILPGMLLTGEK
jgi:hypothetical protein